MNIKSDIIPFLELCRLCASNQNSKSPPFIKIFGVDGVKFGVREKINQHLPIKVEINDGYPQQVCILCVSRLNVCHSLVNTCLQAFNTLQQLKKNSDKEFLNLDSSNNDSYFDGDNFEPFAAPDEDSMDIGNEQLETTSVTCPQQGNAKTEDVKIKTEKLDVSTAGVITSQAVVIIAEKLDKHMRLNLVLVNVKPGEITTTSISDKVSRAMNIFRKQCNWQEDIALIQAQENPMFACTACSISFSEKVEMISHFESIHPREVWGCSDCGESVCGSAEVFSRHQELHQRDVGTDSESELLSSMTCQLDAPVETFEQEFEVIPLGDFQPQLQKKRFTIQANRILGMATGHKSVKPEMKSKVIKALHKFFEKFKNIAIKSLRRARKAKVQCNICHKTFSRKLTLKYHMENIHVPKIDNYLRAPCCHCGKVVREDLVAEHVELSHFGGQDLMCRLCDRIFKITGEVQPHMQTESVKPFRCPHVPCKRGFRRKENLVKHIEMEHTETSEELIPKETEKTDYKSEPAFLCATCGKTFKERKALIHHMKTHIEGMFICELCGKTFCKLNGLKNHKYTIHKDRISCEICGKSYYRTYMAIHLMRHSGAQFSCRYCGKLLTTKSNLRYHELRHNGVPRAKCPLCNCYFMTAEIMERHKATHKEGEEIYIPPHLRPEQCNICQKVLKSKFLLRQHMYSHNQDSQLSLNECGNKFLSKNALMGDMSNKSSPKILQLAPRKKNSVKRFSCQFCDKDFALKSTLLDHESKHQGKRNHSCKFCEKTFFYSGGYYKHLHKKHGIAPSRAWKRKGTTEVCVAVN